MDISSVSYDSPYSCYINLTSRCNLRCKHCFGSYSTHHKNELNLEQWKRIIEDLIANKVFFVNISGGEVTQSPYFKEFIKFLSEKGMHFILTTNGVFPKSIRDFIFNNSEYLIGIKISLDGPDAESNGFVRLDANGQYNAKLFDITLENIKFFKRKKIPLTIATVLHKRNIDKMDKFQKLIRNINPTSWFVSPIIPIGRGDENKFIAEFYEFLETDFWRNLEKRGNQKRINIRLIDVPVELRKEGVSTYVCPAALNFCEIHSDGTVSPCTLARVCIPKKYMQFENIKEKSLKEIWNGKSFNKFRSYMNKGCAGCKMITKCNKCIAQSFRYFGNGESPTPFCIKIGNRLELKGLDKFKKILKDKHNIKIE